MDKTQQWVACVQQFQDDKQHVTTKQKTFNITQRLHCVVASLRTLEDRLCNNEPHVDFTHWSESFPAIPFSGNDDLTILQEIKNAIESLSDLEKLPNYPKDNKQFREHYDAILNYLKSYCKHIETVLNQKKRDKAKFQLDLSSDYTQHKLRRRKRDKLASLLNGLTTPQLIDESQVMRSSPKEIEGMTAELEQQFKEENKFFVNHINTLNKQLKDVERQITELAQATNYIAEEVETQAEKLGNAHSLIMESRDNFARGNSNLRTVTASSSDFRLCVLVLVIFLTFSLLFLHWIYP